MRQVFIADADAGIRYFDQDVFIHIVKSDFGSPPVLTVFYGIADQIDQYLSDILLISLDMKRSVHAVFKGQGNVAFLCLHLEIIEDFTGEIPNIKGLNIECYFATLQTGNDLQIL